MQFLLTVIDGTDEPFAAVDAHVAENTTGTATQDEMNAVDVFNDKLVADGHWVFAGGLGELTNVSVIDNRHGRAVFTDGPFVESKEYVGGLWIIDAPDLATARALAAEGSKACNRKVEVRPFLGE